MLMCTFRQLFHPTGKTRAFFVLYFCLSYWKNTSLVFVCECAEFDKEIVLILVPLEGELCRNFQKFTHTQNEKEKKVYMYFYEKATLILAYMDLTASCLNNTQQENSHFILIISIYLKLFKQNQQQKRKLMIKS